MREGEIPAGAAVTDGRDRGRVIDHRHRYISDREVAPLVQWERRGFTSFAVTPLTVIESEPPAFAPGDRVSVGGKEGQVYHVHPDPADPVIYVEVGTEARAYHPDQLCPAEPPPDEIVKVWRRFGGGWVYAGITGYASRMSGLRPGDLVLPADHLPPEEPPPHEPAKPNRREPKRQVEQLTFL